MTPSQTLLHALELQRAGKLSDALIEYERAQREDAADPTVWFPYGVAALDARDYPKAIALLAAYARAVPDRGAGHFELARAHFLTGDYVAARAGYARTLELKPDYAPALVALGAIAYAEGRAEEGFAYHDAVLATTSEKTVSRFVRSIIRLLRGDYRRGWPEHEARWEMPQFMNPEWAHPPYHRWTGQRTEGKPIVLHPEGGLGDTLMLSRFVPRIARDYGPVILAVQSPLLRLLTTSLGEHATVVSSDALEPDGYHAGFFSIPSILGLELDDCAIDAPYLRASRRPPVARTREGPLQVGLVWAGNPAVAHDMDRSVPSLDVLAPLLQVPGIEWTSLHVGPRAREAVGTPLRQWPLRDMADTAVMIESLDLVISVDTSVAHLAAGMGTPTWIMVPTVPEFRWLLDRGDSPWYPSVTVWRRERTAAWAPMVADMARDLAALVARRAGV